MLKPIEQRGLAPARIHVDAGGREWRDHDILPDVRRLRRLLLAQGFVEGRDLHYVEERHARHSESDWARRLPDALRFLLAETSRSPAG